MFYDEELKHSSLQKRIPSTLLPEFTKSQYNKLLIAHKCMGKAGQCKEGKIQLFHHFPKDKSSKPLFSKVQVDCRHSVYHLIASNFSCMGIYELAGDHMQCSFAPLFLSYISP